MLLVMIYFYIGLTKARASAHLCIITAAARFTVGPTSLPSPIATPSNTYCKFIRFSIWLRADTA